MYTILNRPEFKSWRYVSLAHIGFVSADLFVAPAPFDRHSSDPPNDHLLVTARWRILSRAHLRCFAAFPQAQCPPFSTPHVPRPCSHPTSIMNGDTEAGVCVISMMEKSMGIDAGDILARSTV